MVLLLGVLESFIIFAHFGFINDNLLFFHHFNGVHIGNVKISFVFQLLHDLSLSSSGALKFELTFIHKFVVSNDSLVHFPPCLGGFGIVFPQLVIFIYKLMNVLFEVVDLILMVGIYLADLLLVVGDS